MKTLMLSLVRSGLRFCKNRSGVAAIEFIFAAILFLILLLGMLEVGSLILVNQKAERASFSIANNMSASTPALSVRILDSFGMGQRLFSPFPYAGGSGVAITAINKVGTNPATIAWQRTSAEGIESHFPTSGNATAALATVAPGFTLADNEGVYVVEVTFDYTTLLTPQLFTAYLGDAEKVITSRNIILPRDGGLIPNP
jgi:Flp pilus assembly protein TadG